MRAAIGLVRRARGTPRVDWHWTRGLVVRRARTLHLQLIDVLELGDDRAGNRVVLERLADLAASAGIDVLITHGLPELLGEHLARDLRLRHEFVRALPTPRPDVAETR